MKYVFAAAFVLLSSVLSAQVKVVNLSSNFPEKQILFKDVINTLKIENATRLEDVRIVLSGMKIVNWNFNEGTYDAVLNSKEKELNIELLENNKKRYSQFFQVEEIGDIDISFGGNIEKTISKTDLRNGANALSTHTSNPNYKSNLRIASFEVYQLKNENETLLNSKLLQKGTLDTLDVWNAEFEEYEIIVRVREIDEIQADSSGSEFSSELIATILQLPLGTIIKISANVVCPDCKARKLISEFTLVE